jgi:hypothetical protein
MPNKMWWVIVGAVIFFGAALVTLRAAEQATDRPARPPTSHPAPSAPEESATIVDDPTVAPDAAQSADNNISFPTDI